MILDDLYVRLKTVGIPLAYHHFRKPVSTPYFVYYEAATDFDGSDFKNDIITHSVVIELYSDIKDMAIEERIERELDFTHFEKEVVFIPEENVYETIYTFDLIEKRG